MKSQFNQALITKTNINDLESCDKNNNQIVRNRYLKPILGLIFLIITILFVLILILYIDFCYNIKKSPVFLKNVSSSTPNLNKTSSEIKKFQWSHCGQTHAQPSVNISHRQSKRIIGGENAVEHSWPFLVSIRLVNRKNSISEHKCGGSLITDQYILTAAHCVFYFFKILNHYNLTALQMSSIIEVYVGLNDHDVDPKMLNSNNVYNIEYIDFYDEFRFDSNVIVHDIGIVKLSRKVDLNRPEVNVVCLPFENEIHVGDEVVAIGWGTYAEEFNFIEFVKDRVQQAVFTVKDINDEMCNMGDIGLKWDKNSSLCAYSDDMPKGTCYGDSGGPVLGFRNDRWLLYGIISFGHDIIKVDDKNKTLKKCNASLPFYFVKVDSYLNWIKKETSFTVETFQ